MTSNVLTKLQRDVKFLAVNQIPMEASGVKIEKLDYEGDSSDDDNKLGDEDVRKLVDSIKNNTTFSGPLNLKGNNLTDLVSYNISILPLI